jgi:3-deoxy-D-manno-octulosonic-acid transferase
VVFGPYYENQRAIADALIAAGAARIVNDTAELESTCAEWLGDAAARIAAGERGRRVIELMGGGSAATLQSLRALLART